MIICSLHEGVSLPFSSVAAGEQRLGRCLLYNTLHAMAQGRREGMATGWQTGSRSICSRCMDCLLGPAHPAEPAIYSPVVSAWRVPQCYTFNLRPACVVIAWQVPRSCCPFQLQREHLSKTSCVGYCSTCNRLLVVMQRPQHCRQGRSAVG